MYVHISKSNLIQPNSIDLAIWFCFVLYLNFELNIILHLYLYAEAEFCSSMTMFREGMTARILPDCLLYCQPYGL